MNIASQYQKTEQPETADASPLADNAPMTKKQAQKLTDRIRGAADHLWYLLLDAHDGKAWKALGYPTWEAYVKAEFDMSRRNSYRLLDQARVARAIEENVPHAAQITQRDADVLKADLPAAAAEIKHRVDAGEATAQAVKETVDATREAKAKAKEEKKAKQAENDALRDKTREDLSPAIQAQEEAKRKAIEARKAKADKDAADGEDDGLSPEDRIAELEEAVRVLEQENAALRAENKLYGEMRVQYAQGGFDKVVAGKDEEIRVLQTRLYRESEDKASWMRSAKAGWAKAKELGWSRDEVIDIETGEFVND